MRNLKKVLALALATVMLLGMMAMASAKDYVDAEAINDIIADEEISLNDRATLVSAITLSTLKCFEPTKIDALCHIATNGCHTLSVRAITGLVIALFQYEERLAYYPTIAAALAALRDNSEILRRVQTIQIQLLRCRETQKIDRKMREEIIPAMLKNPQLGNGKLSIDILKEIEEDDDKNPEWSKWIENDNIKSKLEEMTKWQIEGADVYMGTFSQLKNYPFFGEMSNWFRPFDINVPGISSLLPGNNAAGDTLLSAICKSPVFCNSDKYSFCLTVQRIPLEQRQALMGQLTGEDGEAMDIDTYAQANKERFAEIESNSYIQDLYRFFKLWRGHQEEEDIFRWPFNLWENPWLKEVFSSEETTKELADYLLQKEYLEEAYTLFQKLTALNTKQAEVYQKAGFILQKQMHCADAIQHYKHADLLQPDNVWTNKHLAQCYRLLGNLPKALVYYRKVEAVQPDNLNIALQIGQCLARMEQYADALAYFYKVEYLEKNPDNARRAIAWCSFVSGKHEEALKYYQLLLAEPSPKAQDWMNAGHVYFVLHQVPQAIEHYLKAQSFEKSHTAFVEKFNKDKTALLALGLLEEDLQIMLDLIA